MNRRRRWRVNLLSGRTAALVVLGLCFLAGGITGCVTAGVPNVGDSSAFAELLGNYLSALQQGTAAVRFLPVLWQTIRVPLLAFVLGLTAIGVIGLPAVFAVRGFGFCYAVSVFYRLFGMGGLVLSTCLLALPALLWLPALLELGVVGLTSSYGLLRRVAGEGRYPLPLGGRYWLHCGICMGAILLAAGAECILVPAVLRLVLQWLQF